MTGYRAFSYKSVKTFPILSKGFEIETEMTIHSLDKNMNLENVIVEYRNRPIGSVSKLHTCSDGFKVINTITGLVPKMPSFLTSIFFFISAIQSFFGGLILQTMVKNEKQGFEISLNECYDRYVDLKNERKK